LQLEDVRKADAEIWMSRVTATPPIDTPHDFAQATIDRRVVVEPLGSCTHSNETGLTGSGWRAEITAVATADNSRERLTVADEREHVLFFVVEVTTNHPVFYQKIEQAIEKVFGPARRDIDVPEIIGSVVVGGDMDNNPDVTPRPFAKPSRVINNSSSTVIFWNANSCRSCCRER